MAVKIANLKILVSAQTGGVSAGMNKARTSVTGFQRGVGKLGGLLKFVGPQMLAMAAGFAATAIAALSVRAAISTLSKQFGELDKLGKTASKLGLTVEALQNMRFAGKQTGVEITTVDMALQRWTKNLSKAATGSTELEKIFVDLGLDAKQLTTLPLEEQMKAFADALKGAATQGDRVRIAAAILDSEGVALVNTLQGGSAALDEMFRDRGELGLFTAEQVARIESANNNMTRLGVQVNFIAGSIAAALAPVLDVLVGKIVDFGKRGKFNFDKIIGVIKTFAIGTALTIDVWFQLNKRFNVAWMVVKGLAKAISWLTGELADLDVGLDLGTLIDTPVTDQVRSFFDDVAAKTEEIAKNTEKVKDDLGKVPKEVPVPTPEEPKPEKPEPAVAIRAKKLVAPLLVTLPAALEKGTAAAFSLIAKATTQAGIKDVVKWTEQTVEQLEEQSAILREIARRPVATLQAAAI